MVTDAVVLAGGLGTRIRSVTGGHLPKALVPVLGRPFIGYKLKSLAAMGITRAVLLLGHGASQVESYVGDGQDFDLKVEYFNDGNHLLGTAGAIRAALDLLPERFWVTYGDSLGIADLHGIEENNLSSSTEAVMTVLRNEDRWDASNVHVDEGLVTSYRGTPPEGGYKWIDYGLLLLPRNRFTSLPACEVRDLAVVINDLVACSALQAAEVTHRFWEIGTPEAIAATEAHFAEFGMWDMLR
jgi:D-glycero-D-manno-heptose 1,7-bisphosphate phosphatase